MERGIDCRSGDRGKGQSNRKVDRGARIEEEGSEEWDRAAQAARAASEVMRAKVATPVVNQASGE